LLLENPDFMASPLDQGPQETHVDDLPQSAQSGQTVEATEEVDDEIPPQAGRGAPDAATAEMADVGEVPDLPASPDEAPTGWDEMLLDDLSGGPRSKGRPRP